MADFVHCNKCMTRSVGIQYFMSSCCHLFCSKCAEGLKNQCSMCKKTMKLVPIDNKLHPNLKMYFADPVKLVAEEMSKLIKIWEHQKNMTDHLMQHLIKEKEQKKLIEAHLDKRSKDFEKQKNDLKKKSEWIKMAESKIAHQHAEMIDMKQQIQQLEQEKMQKSTDFGGCSNMSKYDFVDPQSDISSIGRSTESSFNLMSPAIQSPSSTLDPLVPPTFEEPTFSAIPKRSTNTFNDVFNNIGGTPCRFEPVFGFQEEQGADDRNRSRNKSLSFERRDTSANSGNRSLNASDGYFSQRERDDRFPKSGKELKRYSTQPGLF